MEDSIKVRLVRCPKCQNLLHELADYSVYQCGGCGAVLRAKDETRSPGSDSFSEKPKEERERGNSLNSEGSLESRVFDSKCDFDADGKSKLGCAQRELLEDDGEEKCHNQSRVADEECIDMNTLDMNGNSKKLGKSIGRENEEYNSIVGSPEGSKISDRMSGRQYRERGEIGVCQRNLRTDMEDERRFSVPGSSYSYGGQWRRHKDHDDATKVQYLEQNRADLLRKLNELKDQLSRSCHMVDDQKEKFSFDERILPPDSYGRSGLKRDSLQFLEPDKHAAGPSFINLRHDQFSYANNHGTSVHNCPRTSSQHSYFVSRYQDPYGYGPQMMKRASQRLPYQFPQQPIHPYFSGQYLNNSDAFDTSTHIELLHHPSCSCFYCSEVKQGSVPLPPTTLACRRFPDIASDPSLYHHEISGKFGPHLYNSRTIIPRANTRGTQSQKGWPSELKPETVYFVQNNLQKVMLVRSSRRCRPVAGGSPFLTCYSCFELLQMPYKALSLVKSNKQKLRCGVCSIVMIFSVINRKLVFSPRPDSNGILREVVHSSDEAIIKKGIDSHRHNWSGAGTNFSSDDYDNLGFDFLSITKESTSFTTVSDSRKPQEMQSLHSSSPSTFDDENSPEVMITARDVISNVPQPAKAVPSPPPGSPLEECFDHSSNHRVINRFGKGNRSGRSEQEVEKMNKATSRQNSLKEGALATEVEVSFNDYFNNGVSQESGDVGKEDDDQKKNNKTGESFFANIIKKSFKDLTRFNQSNEHGKSIVSVNGHIIPYRVLKKVEKLAGPIQPGKYWYDVHAGFWGILGGPCLGIIPPFIEDLNYPMPENCAGGNTRIFVNGRELHQNDLDLLSGRGLPINADRSYIVEISGRVFDEDTSEELDSLGKLAPTVEKLKHGFGMKPPRVAS